MIDPISATVFFKLATWSLRAVNEVVKLNNLTQKRSSGNKSSSGAISKIDRQLKETELKYYQDKTKRERDLLAIEKQKLANDNIRIEIEEARLGIDTDRLKLSKQERQDRLESRSKYLKLNCRGNKSTGITLEIIGSLKLVQKQLNQFSPNTIIAC